MSAVPYHGPVLIMRPSRFNASDTPTRGSFLNLDSLSYALTEAKLRATIVVALSSAVFGLLVARVVGIQSPCLVVVCILAAHVTIRHILAVVSIEECLRWPMR